MKGKLKVMEIRRKRTEGAAADGNNSLFTKFLFLGPSLALVKATQFRTCHRKGINKVTKTLN